MSIIAKKTRGANRISTIKIKRVAGRTLLYIKLCPELASALRGSQDTDVSATLRTATGEPVQVCLASNQRWQAIFRELQRVVSCTDSNTAPLYDSYGTISVYPLRVIGLEQGIELAYPDSTVTLAGLQSYAEKMNMLLSAFYTSYVKKVEIVASLSTPVGR